VSDLRGPGKRRAACDNPGKAATSEGQLLSSRALRRFRRAVGAFSTHSKNNALPTHSMTYLRLTLLASLVLATAGCHRIPDEIEYYFSSDGALRHDTSASEDDDTDEATLVIRSLP
jgi:hypothetical protein